MSDYKSVADRQDRQIDKLLEAISTEGVDVPCPSNVGLPDNCISDCADCWRKALAEVE